MMEVGDQFVPSRRAEQVLGVDPDRPRTHDRNDGSCHLGCRTPVVDMRLEHLSNTKEFTELRKALSLHAPVERDWMIVAASSETGPHDANGCLVRQVKESR